MRHDQNYDFLTVRMNRQFLYQNISKKYDSPSHSIECSFNLRYLKVFHSFFQAYKLLHRNTKANLLLPGVPLSPDQLFFVSFAQVFIWFK